MKHALRILYGIIALLSVMILFTVFTFVRRHAPSASVPPASISSAASFSAPDQAASSSKTLREMSHTVTSEPASVSSSENRTASSVSENAAAVSANTASANAASKSSSPSQNAAAQSTVSVDTQHFVIPTDQTVILDTVMGSMQYFNQMDSHWGSYLINGKDPMSTNGCGPTCVAMVIHAFGSASEQITPVEMADWAVQNQQYVVGAGSEHTIVETALQSHGLTVTSLQNSLSKETIVSELQKGHLLIGLMGPGFFTDEGHYLLMTGLDASGNVCIADPHSSENTSKPFTADFLISQLRTDAKDGGAPLWSISRP